MGFNLGKLLEDVSNLDTGREQIEYIRLDLIDEDPNNFYQLSDIDNLAANIELCGLQQPIRVRPVPGTDRYMIVSGHRRRKALELLAQDAPQRWSEAPCIVETDEASPALQQLRLIFANSSTRTMTNAEISEQAVQVENLLYRLKEEEGYEFPGRMRDHVAEVVGASKTKLARLKVIRENLAKCFQPAFKKNEMVESVAYAVAQLPEADQQTLWESLKANDRTARWLDAHDIKEYKERLVAIEKLKCKRRGRECPCQNAANKKLLAASTPRYVAFSCTKCCSSCPSLISCKHACPVMADKIAKLKADAREARKEVRDAQTEKDRPAIEKISALWQRFGLARKLAHKEFDDCKRAMGISYYSFAADDVAKLECGEKKVTPQTKLPYNYNCYLSDIKRLIDLADFLGCSIDYLLCRTDIREMARPDGAVSESDTGAETPVISSGGWYPATVEPPVGVELVLIDSGGFADTGKYLGCGQFTMDYGDPVIFWSLMPGNNDVSQSAPAVIGWHVGNPGAYGNYVAYVQFSEGSKKALRELLWTGEEWLMFGETLADGVIVCCWTEQPEL